VEESIKSIKTAIRSIKGVNPEAGPTLQKHNDALTAAVAAMETHFQNLARRESNPTVGDKLRNLKNVFKDKSALAAQRKSAENFFKTGIKPQIADAQRRCDKVLKRLKEDREFWDSLFAKTG
jgi:hypothetical protein